jgi:hypothetical protein
VLDYIEALKVFSNAHAAAWMRFLAAAVSPEPPACAAVGRQQWQQGAGTLNAEVRLGSYLHPFRHGNCCVPVVCRNTAPPTPVVRDWKGPHLLQLHSPLAMMRTAVLAKPLAGTCLQICVVVCLRPCNPASSFVLLVSSRLHKHLVVHADSEYKNASPRLLVWQELSRSGGHDLCCVQLFPIPLMLC